MYKISCTLNCTYTCETLYFWTATMSKISENSLNMEVLFMMLKCPCHIEVTKKVMCIEAVV